MIYFTLEPEVAGGFGPASSGDLRARPPRLATFNYEFDTWLGDPLLEAISCFIVTDVLKDRLIEARMSGVTFGDVEITKSGEFEDRYPQRVLPRFSWLQVRGQAGRDDFGLSAAGDLVVSERALTVLRSAGLKHCEVSERDPRRDQ
jgi:hypothetical protein